MQCRTAAATDLVTAARQMNPSVNVRRARNAMHGGWKRLQTEPAIQAGHKHFVLREHAGRTFAAKDKEKPIHNNAVNAAAHRRHGRIRRPRACRSVVYLQNSSHLAVESGAETPAD